MAMKQTQSNGLGSALDTAMLGVTQDAVLRNVEGDLQRAAAEQAALEGPNDFHLEHTREALAAARLGTDGPAGGGDKDDEFDDEFDDDPDLRALEQRRIAQMKAMAAKKMANQAKGHGELRTIVEEEFLAECCKSDRVVVHFYHADFERCKIADKHLGDIAKKHTTCKFVRIDAEKSPFFVNKLGIRMLPTILIFHDGVNKDRIVGFDELGGEDDFPTRTLEVRLHMAGAIYLKEGKPKKASALGFAHNGTYSDDDDSDDKESDASDEE
mmetsp:Transcript_22339/g.65865  ORF Transcript_22339/g.65865 Transcript_22339/m.65865 type:complete len:269 (+) Transcript_22339:69-875(+)